jgi:hypothetical protein
MLQPGEQRSITASIDPRLAARFDEPLRHWQIAAGTYGISAGFDIDHRDCIASLTLGASSLAP